MKLFTKYCMLETPSYTDHAESYARYLTIARHVNFGGAGRI